VPVPTDETSNNFKYGPGVYKLDWACTSRCRGARLVRASRDGHLGGTLEDLRVGTAAVEGKVSDRPYVLFTQASLLTVARARGSTRRGYCHVPNGFSGNVAEAIEKQVEASPRVFGNALRGAQCGPSGDGAAQPQFDGGDIGGGAAYLNQLFLRPTASLYRTLLDGVFSVLFLHASGAGCPWDVGYSRQKRHSNALLKTRPAVDTLRGCSRIAKG